ncbi:glycosyltransferase [Pseudoalteromonas rubra]|uniref:glycosyltransferase n=1 Tax=Pseudoalteromonas rubra TaxID=43658 RepID=UPI000F7913A2|nr:glycosyltransferase [Pseudoalteromonas rubra]
MKDRPNFSALCSVYVNEQADYLNEAFLSLERQSLSATEVVVVLDGPLNTELYQCIAEWKERLPIKIVELECNLGLGAALNKGLEACSYEIVARFDTDDINANDRFEKQIDFLEKNPNIDVVSASVSEFETVINDMNSLRNLPESHEGVARLAKYRNPVNHMAVMFRKSAVISVGSYKDLHFMEDYYLWLRMLAANKKFSNITAALVHARVGNGMHKRRKGFHYIKSEYKLFKIKKVLGITTQLHGGVILAFRVIPRLFPTALLRVLYSKLRAKK